MKKSVKKVAAKKKPAVKPAPKRARAGAVPAVQVPLASTARALAMLRPAVPLKKSPLSRKELQEFRQMLLAKRRSLVGDMTEMENEALKANRADGGDLSQMPDHPANIATDNYEQEFTLGLLESERTLLVEIDQALERIADNTFGICLATGRPINKERLLARPWSKYCIEYARLVEKGLVRAGEDRADDQQDEKAAEDEEEETHDEPEESEE